MVIDDVVECSPADSRLPPRVVCLAKDELQRVEYIVAHGYTCAWRTGSFHKFPKQRPGKI